MTDICCLSRFLFVGLTWLVLGWAQPNPTWVELTQPAAYQPVDVLTHHNNNYRSGHNASESILTPFDVRNQLGRLFSYRVNGQVYAQPLYVSDLRIPDVGVRNVVIIATQEDCLYAFDADRNVTFWSVDYTGNASGVSCGSVNNSVRGARGASAVPFTGPQPPYPDVQKRGDFAWYHVRPGAGILSTPVIDRSTNTLFVVAYTLEAGNPTYRIHAVDLATGAEKVSSNGRVIPTYQNFQASRQLQRPALALSNGIVYVAFGSHVDYGNWGGYLFGYNTRDLGQTSSFTTIQPQNPDLSSGAAIWQSGNGPAIDEDGNIYVTTGNNPQDSPQFENNLANRILKLRPSPNLAVLATFDPPRDALHCYDCYDLDLGSSGPVLLPNHRLIYSGKEALLYTFEYSQANALSLLNSFQIIGTSCDRPRKFGETCSAEAFAPGLPTHHVHGSPVYWNSPKRNGATLIYLWPENDVLHAFLYDGNSVLPNDVDHGTLPAAPGMPGGVLALSSNNSAAGSGMLWVMQPRPPARSDNSDNVTDPLSNPRTGECFLSSDSARCLVHGIVRVFDADNIAMDLWNSGNPGDRDYPGIYAKYTPPTIANGKVYVATLGASAEYIDPQTGVPVKDEWQDKNGSVSVYGLLPKRTVRSSGFFIQSNFGSRGNFEIVVPKAGMLKHNWRDNDAPTPTWDEASNESSGVGISAVSLVESNFSSQPGGMGPGNLEVLVRAGSDLSLYYKTDSALGFTGPSTENIFNSSPSTVIGSGVVGTPAMIQSRFGGKGNFEVIVPLATGGLRHYWRDNDSDNSWHRGADFGQALGVFSGVSLIQSSFSAGGSVGNLELVAKSGDKLYYFWKPDTANSDWQEPATHFIEGVSGDPCMIQSRWGIKGNFELVAPLSTGGIGHWWRDNDNGNVWQFASTETFGRNLMQIQRVSVIQSNFTGGAGVGNLEVVAQTASGSLHHFWKADNSSTWLSNTQSPLP